MIFFLEKNQYQFLIGKRLNVDQLTSMLKDIDRSPQVAKHITPASYYKIIAITNKLNTLLHTYSDSLVGTYMSSLTTAEQQHINDDIHIGFNTATKQGDTEKYYEIVKAPNGDTVIVYDNYIAKYMSESKDHILALILAVMEIEHNAGTLYGDLLKKYFSVKDAAFNINIVKLKLLNFV
jgi:hypothetical protein